MANAANPGKKEARSAFGTVAQGQRGAPGLTQKNGDSSNNKALFAVTGAERPYIFDLPHLLSLPWGFEFRFRYRETWVENKLVESLRAGADFADRKLIILFHSKHTERLLPIRSCRVVALEELGPVFYLRFAVEGYPVWDEMDETDRETTNATAGLTKPLAAASLDEATRRISDQTCRSTGLNPSKLANALPPGSYLSTIEDMVLSNDSHWSPEPETAPAGAKDWGNTLDLLSYKEEQLFGVPMFYLLGFQCQDGSWLRPRRLKKHFQNTAKRGFILTNNSRYRLRLVEWRRDTPEHALLQIGCDFSENLLTLEGSSGLVVGKYDVPEFSLHASCVGYGELAIQTEPLPPRGAASDTSEAQATNCRKEPWPSVFSARVPIQIKRDWRKLAASAIVFLCGVASIALSQFIGLEKIPKALLETLGMLFVFYSAGKVATEFGRMTAGLAKIPINRIPTSPQSGGPPL